MNAPGEWYKNLAEKDRELVELSGRVPRFIANLLQPLLAFYDDPRNETSKAHGAICFTYAIADCAGASFSVSAITTVGSPAQDFEQALHQQQHMLEALAGTRDALEDLAETTTSLFCAEDDPLPLNNGKMLCRELQDFYENFQTNFSSANDLSKNPFDL